MDLDRLLMLHPLLPLAWQAATESGALLRDERPQNLGVSTKSTPTDVVTEMDRRSEQMIVDLISAQRPDDAILGEEGGERSGTSGVRWVVDPLDATVNYLYRLPMWGVSVAAEIDGEAVVGVVVAPELGESYLAVRGAGSWCVRGNEVQGLKVSLCQDLSTALVTTGFGYAPQQRDLQAYVVRTLLPEVRDIRRTGCAVVDFCWLASGRLDAYYERGLNAWDMAAGALIAQEAGAVVTGVNGADPCMVAAPAPIAELLRPRVHGLHLEAIALGLGVPQ